MLARIRHTVLLLVEIVRFSIATRNVWLIPFVVILLALMAVVGAAEVVVPYAIYPIF